MPLKDFRIIEKEMLDFNGTTFVDCTELVHSQRLVKSKLE